MGRPSLGRLVRSGFGGWRGDDWGVPNVSSVQDWSRGAVVKPVTTAVP